MAKKRFSRPPRVNGRSRPPQRTVGGSLSREVQEFKNTYVFERRVLERFRSGETALYQPAPSLDGKSKFDTPEERTGVNQWQLVYDKLRKAQSRVSPARFVRLLFKILRGSSLSIPTVQQLATPSLLKLVVEFLDGLPLEIRAQLVSEAQRARSSIVLSQKAGGTTLALAVYYAIVDSRLELSPIFKYCLAITTAEKIRENRNKDLHCEKLEKLAKQFEFLAVMDYTLFRDLYDEIWQDAIPGSLRVAADNFGALASQL